MCAHRAPWREASASGCTGTASDHFPLHQHPLVAAIRVPRVDGDAVVYIEREGVGRVVEKDGGGLRVTATGEEDEVAVETAKVLDVQTVVHVDAVIARQTMLDELLVAVEELADQFRVGLNAGRKHDELVVLAHRLQKVKHVGSKTQVHLVRLAIADLRSTGAEGGYLEGDIELVWFVKIAVDKGLVQIQHECVGREIRRLGRKQVVA